MRISICDDNRNELQDIFLLTEKYVQGKGQPKTGKPAKLLQFESAAELLAYEDVHGASDVYILDVIMPDTDGIALGRLLHKRNPRAFILYLTNSKEFAIEAFTVKAFSYLLKPVTEQQLFHELDLLYDMLRQSETQIKIRGRSGIQFLTLDEVSAVEYFSHHLIYHTTEGQIEGLQQREAFDISVSEFMESGCFLKVSASHIINMRHVRSVNRENFILDDGSVYKITRNFSDAKKKYLDFIIEE